jgi:hypothetical protein
VPPSPIAATAAAAAADSAAGIAATGAPGYTAAAAATAAAAGSGEGKKRVDGGQLRNSILYGIINAVVGIPTMISFAAIVWQVRCVGARMAIGGVRAGVRVGGQHGQVTRVAAGLSVWVATGIQAGGSLC